MRLWGLEAPGLWQDEALSHYYALHDPAWILRYAAGPINHPPLFFLLLHGWLGLVPAYDQALVELMNVLVGLASIGVFYRWVQYVLDWRWAGGLSLVLALHPFHVYYSTELRMYALAGLGVTAMAYFATRLLLGDLRSSVNWLGWMLASLVSVYSHSFTLLPVLVGAGYLGIRSYRWGCLSRWLKSILVLGALYLPWSVFVLNQALRISGDYWLPAFRWEYLPTLTLWMGGFLGPKGNGVYYWLICAGVLIGLGLPALASFARFKRSDVRLSWFLVLAPVIIVVVVSLTGQSVFLYRVFFPLLGLLLYVVAPGYTVLPRWLGLVCLGVFLATVTVETLNLKNNPPNQYTREVSDWIRTHRTTGTLVLHTSGSTYFPARFYQKNSGNEFLVGVREHLGVTLSASQRKELGRRRAVLLLHPAGERPRWLGDLESRVKRTATLRAGGRHYEAVFLGEES